MLSRGFDSEDYPGRPKILFIGFPESSHTHSWIDLLRGERFNVRLFGLTSAVPPDDWPVRTYVTADVGRSLNPSSRRTLSLAGTSSGRFVRIATKVKRYLVSGTPSLPSRAGLRASFGTGVLTSFTRWASTPRPISIFA